MKGKNGEQNRFSGVTCEESSVDTTAFGLFLICGYGELRFRDSVDSHVTSNTCGQVQIDREQTHEATAFTGHTGRIKKRDMT